MKSYSYTINGQSPAEQLIDLPFPAVAMQFENLRPETLFIKARGTKASRSDFDVMARYWSRGVRLLPGTTRVSVLPLYVGGVHSDTGRVLSQTILTFFDSDQAVYDNPIDGFELTTTPFDIVRTDTILAAGNVTLQTATVLQRIAIRKSTLVNPNVAAIIPSLQYGLVGPTFPFFFATVPANDNRIFDSAPEWIHLPIGNSLFLVNSGAAPANFTTIMQTRIYTFPA